MAAGSNRFIHVPIKLMIFERNQVAPGGDLRLSVLESTAQPMNSIWSLLRAGGVAVAEE